MEQEKQIEKNIEKNIQKKDIFDKIMALPGLNIFESIIRFSSEGFELSLSHFWTDWLETEHFSAMLSRESPCSVLYL